MVPSFSYLEPIMRMIGRLMTMPENTHSERITTIMALLLAGLFRWPCKNCLAWTRPWQPRRPEISLAKDLRPAGLYPTDGLVRVTGFPAPERWGGWWWNRRKRTLRRLRVPWCLLTKKSGGTTTPSGSAMPPQGLKKLGLL